MMPLLDLRRVTRRRLLVLACSATKRPDPGHLPARERYDGPLWRTLRATDPDGRAKVAFLSARYGFRAADTPIQDYEARLTPDLAAPMISGGMPTRWPRPPSPRKPDNYGMHPGAEIASLSGYGRDPLDEVALVGGDLYLEACGPCSPGSSAWAASNPAPRSSRSTARSAACARQCVPGSLPLPGHEPAEE